MKNIIYLVLALITFFVTTGCSASSETTSSQKILNVGMLLARGGLGDRSFNDSAYAGLQAAKKQYNIRFETVDYVSDEANTSALRNFANQNYDLIIGVGFENAGVIQAVANAYPDRNFAAIDAVAEAENAASVIYREQEGDFLMGVLVAMLTESKKVGFIGGADIEIIRRIETGFAQGVAHQDSTVEIVSDLAETFIEPEIGKAMALQQYAAGVDVIYNGAGRTGLGIIEAAKEANKLTVGTSGDQRYLAPGNVVGNRPKRVDTAVLNLVQEIHAGQFTTGIRSLGLAEEGLALGPFDDNIVTAEMQARLDQLKQQIIDGDLDVSIE